MTTIFKDQVSFETYGETISAGQPLYKSTGTGNDSGRTAGRLYLLDVSNPDRNKLYGIAKDAGVAADANKRVVQAGRAEGFSALTAGIPVYAGATAGSVTQVKPTSNIQVIGMAIDADTVFVNSALAGSFVATEGGAAGVGGTDILLAQTFDTAALGDFTQTGLSLINTNTIKGAQSARLIHQSGSPQSFKQVISVDRKFRSQLMQLSLSLQSTAPQGDVTLNLYDETNAANIVASEQLSTGSQAISGLSTTNASPTISGFTNAIINTLAVGERITGSGIPTGSIITAINSTALTVTISQNATATASGLTLNVSDLPARKTVGFRIPASCASLSYTITALAESGLPETYVDDLVIELDQTALLKTSVEVPVVTAWQGYTPTFQGFGTPTNVEFEWRQVGENVEIRGKLTTGTTTSAEARVGLPAGLTSAGTAIIPSIQMIGAATRSGSSAGSFVALIEPSVTYMTFGAQTVAAGGLTKAQGTFLATGETLSLFASVPCAGLSVTQVKEIPLTQSGLIQEADSMIRLNTQNGNGSTNTAIRRFSNITQSLGDDIAYQDSATLGASFTIQESGNYSISYTDQFSGNVAFGISKNSTQLTTDITSITIADRLVMEQTGAANVIASCSWEGYLVAGDVIRPHTGVSPGAGSVPAITQFTIAKQGSLKQVNVITNQKATIPTSELRFEGASSRGAVATAIVRFDTQAKLRGDAFSVVSDANNGTAITMLKAGRLAISSTLVGNATGNALFISRNQTTLTTTPSGSETLAVNLPANSSFTTASWVGDVNSGDVIRISMLNNPTANAANSLNLSFQEQQVQVSVSNVLPQFSESDLLVRAADNAGQAITVDVTNIPFVTVSDSTNGAWNGSVFTVPETGIYSINANVTFTANGSRVVNLYKNGVLFRRIGELSGVTTTQTHYGNLEDQFSAGDTISLRIGGSGGTLLSSTTLHYLNITKVGKPNVTGVNVTPFVNVPQQQERQTRISGTTVTTYTSGSPVTFNSPTVSGDDGASYNTSTGRFTAPYTASYGIDFFFNTNVGTNAQAAIWINGVQTSTIGITYSANGLFTGSGTVKLNRGDLVDVRSNTSWTVAGGGSHLQFTYTAVSDQILTAPETFSTDTAPLQYASSAQYTLSTLANAPVGTYITFTYAANTNARTQTTTRPTQTDADMNTNGMLIYTRAYNATSTAAQPAAIAIQIGKGMKGKSLELYKSAGKSIPASLDSAYGGTKIGAGYKEYNEATGILLVDAGIDVLGSSAQAFFPASDLTNTSSGYLVINASKNASLTGMNIERVSARAVNSAGTTFGTAPGATLVFDANKTFDTHGALNTSTGVFTAPEAGFYQVNAHVTFVTAAYTVNQGVVISGIKNGVPIGRGQIPRANGSVNLFMSPSYSDIVYLAKGDTFSINVVNERGATALFTDGTYNFFSITKTNIGGRN